MTSACLPLRQHSQRFLKRVLQAPLRRKERKERWQEKKTLELRHNAEEYDSASPDLSSLKLKYLPTVTPPFILPNGWAPPPEEPPTNPPPFSVVRTSVGRALPVYTDYRSGRSRVLTIVRRVKGDEREFVRDFKVVCGTDKVEKRGGGFEVQGNHIRVVRDWLYGLGF